MVTISAPAETQLKDLIEKQDEPDLALRVFVSAGGCSGFQYGMALDNSVQEGDEIFEHGDLKVVVDEFSVQYLEGSEIDYVEGLMGAGFTVHNPNAVSTCGCGHSFHTSDEQGQSQQCH